MSIRKDIRNATVTALVDANVAGGNVKAARYRPIKPGVMPMVAVYFKRDDMVALGDANQGPVAFKNLTTIAVEIATSAGGDEPGDDAIIALLDSSEDALFESAAWMSLIEGVEGVTIETTQGAEGDLRYIAARMDITVSFKTEFAPVIPDELGSVSGRAADNRGVDFHPPDGKIEGEFRIPIDTE